MEEKVGRFVEFNQRIGNMYTASLYSTLVSVIARLVLSIFITFKDKKFGNRIENIAKL